MVRHLADSDFLVEVPALEAQEMHRLGGEMESHPVQDLLPFGLGGEEFGRLDVAAEDRIRQRRWCLLGAVNDDFDFARLNLPDDLPGPSEVHQHRTRCLRARSSSIRSPRVTFTTSPNGEWTIRNRSNASTTIRLSVGTGAPDLRWFACSSTRRLAPVLLIGHAFSKCSTAFATLSRSSRASISLRIRPTRWARPKGTGSISPSQPGMIAFGSETGVT